MEEQSRPDYGIFLGIIGVIVGVFFPILQANGVDNVDWRISALIDCGLIALSIWTLYKHAMPHRSKRVRVIVIFIVILVPSWLSIYGVKKQYYKQHSPPKVDISAAIADRVDRLTTELSTNSSDPRIAALSVRKLEASNDEKMLIKEEHEMDDLDAPTLDQMRSERIRQHAIIQNQIYQAKIQEQINGIQNQKIAEENKRKADLDRLQNDRLLSIRVLPLFDYTVRKLDKILKEISHGTGKKRFSDFSGAIPTVYASDLERDERIVSGSNFMCLGHDTAWHFDISTTVVPFGMSTAYKPLEFARLNIQSHATNGDSILTITPVLVFNGQQGYRHRWWQTNDFFTNSELQVSIKLSVSTEDLNIDETSTVPDITNDIDKALRFLIESQDKLSPLRSN